STAGLTESPVAPPTPQQPAVSAVEPERGESCEPLAPPRIPERYEIRGGACSLPRSAVPRRAGEQAPCIRHWVIRHFFVIRDSSFVIRHSHAFRPAVRPTIPPPVRLQRRATEHSETGGPMPRTPHNTGPTRRTFIQSTAAGLAAATLARAASAQAQPQNADNAVTAGQQSGKKIGFAVMGL